MLGNNNQSKSHESLNSDRYKYSNHAIVAAIQTWEKYHNQYPDITFIESLYDIVHKTFDENNIEFNIYLQDKCIGFVGKTMKTLNISCDNRELCFEEKEYLIFKMDTARLYAALVVLLRDGRINLLYE